MNWFFELVSNPYLITSLSSWFIAQLLKVIINAIVNKKLSLERLVGDGGMPSAHSATYSCMAMTAALVYGVGSFEFAVTAMLATVVMHDAMGVRLETGKQAVVINEMIRLFEELGDKHVSVEKKLKEFVGHTPLQVLCGMILGIALAVLYNLWF